MAPSPDCSAEFPSDSALAGRLGSTLCRASTKIRPELRSSQSPTHTSMPSSPSGRTRRRERGVVDRTFYYLYMQFLDCLDYWGASCMVVNEYREQVVVVCDPVKFRDRPDGLGGDTGTRLFCGGLRRNGHAISASTHYCRHQILSTRFFVDASCLRTVFSHPAVLSPAPCILKVHTQTKGHRTIALHRKKGTQNLSHLLLTLTLTLTSVQGKQARSRVSLQPAASE